MPTNDADVAWVPVAPIEVGITLQDVVSALADEAQSMAQPTLAASLDPELAQLVQQLHSLSTQLRDVINRINQIDPNFLESDSTPTSPST